MICPASRDASLVQLGEFISVAGLYARDRNQVKPTHPSVSRLSPAIRHRLITEEEVVSSILGVHSFGRAEKFIQEVYWRRYWKSWLALRPGVWNEYLSYPAEMMHLPAIQQIEESRSGNAVIDHFANELVSTGYLHNHARMWFAAWWVHEARLPWQAGAAFFFRHLLDGDPASNTLSWRWVAGMQTPGKTYLARRSNLEKYLAPELLNSLSGGLAAFENPHPLQPGFVAKPLITQANLSPESPILTSNVGLWIHEEDLAVENSPLGERSFSEMIVTANIAAWDTFRFPAPKRKWLDDALEDAAIRAEQHWKAPTTREGHLDQIVSWAKSNKLQQVATMRPEIGPLNDSLPMLRAALAEVGSLLVLVDRQEDLAIRSFATGGFFQFWERVQKKLFAQQSKNPLPSSQQLTMDLLP